MMNTVVFAHRSAVMKESSQRDAFDLVLPELEALAPEQLLSVNVDVPDAVAAALGALPRIVAQREALSGLPGFDLARFDRLEVYLRALTYAHDAYQVASQPSDDLKSLQEEAAQLRELLFCDATVAMARGFMPKDALHDLKGANGYSNTANDLRILVVALRQNWAKVEGKCATTDEELSYAEKLAFHLLRAYGVRESGPESRAQTTELRIRAFTLCFKLYDEIRQGIGWLRRAQGDADKIAPSLYTFRPRPRKKESPNAAASSADSGAGATGATGAQAAAAQSTAVQPAASQSTHTPAAPGIASGTLPAIASSAALAKEGGPFAA